MRVTTTTKISKRGAGVRDIRIAAMRVANFLAAHPKANAVKVSFEGVRTLNGPYREDRVTASATVTEEVLD